MEAGRRRKVYATPAWGTGWRMPEASGAREREREEASPPLPARSGLSLAEAIRRSQHHMHPSLPARRRGFVPFQLGFDSGLLHFMTHSKSTNLVETQFPV